MIVPLQTIDEIKPLFQKYLEHMCQFFEIYNFDSWCDGAMKKLPLYLGAGDRYIYILKVSDNIIGFSMINQHLRFNTNGFAIAEFFIRNNYEKNGYGRQLAEHTFSQFPGNWEVAVSLKNRNALTFWEKIVSSYTDGRFIKQKKPDFKGCGILFNTQEAL